MIPETHDIQIIERESVAIRSRRDRILALTATDEDSYVELAEALKEGKRYVRWVDETFDPDAAYKAWKVAVEQKKMFRAPGEEIINHANAEVKAWNAEQERLRREAQAAADRERQRLEEAARLAAEAETARLRKEAEDAIIEAAATAEANGDLATAERILAEPVIVPTPSPVVTFTPPVQMPAPTRVKGLSFHRVWECDLISLDDVIREVAAGRAPKRLLKLDESAARDYAKDTEGAPVRGLRFRSSSETTVRLG